MSVRGVLAVTALTLAACSGDRSPALDVGVELLTERKLEEAQRYFDSLTATHPADANVLAWSSDVLFALRRFDAAVERAREALALEPCHGVAHRVMGSSFNPQYQWDRADDDMSWQHFMEARRCDPTDAFTWVESIVPAMRHGQSDVADEAISDLLETGAFPLGSVAFNRWMLHEVPDNAVLVTWGDLDTFPAWGLQLSDGVRPDVAVVNVNLLSAWWYATLIRDRYDLPLVANEPESHTIESTLRAWRFMNAEGTLGRPLVFATTVPRELVADGPGRLQLESGHRSIRVSPNPTPIDSALSAATSIAMLRGADFTARDVTENRPPFRAAYGSLHTLHILDLALQHGTTLVEGGYIEAARILANWAEQFWREAGLATDQIDAVVGLRALLD